MHRDGNVMMVQLAHLIDDTFSDVEKFDSFRHHRYTLQSLYTALDHQLQNGLMARNEFDRMRYIVRKLFNLKLQMHTIEAEPSLPLPADVIEHTIACWICTQRVYFRDHYSSVCVLVCCSIWRTLTDIYTRL